MSVLRILPADASGIAAAATAIGSGGIVAVPTETVYGLAADARDATAVARIYAAKGRPDFNPLIVHVADMAAAERVAHFDALSRSLADALWPGPLTLVLPLREDAGVASIVTAGLPTVALRVSAHPVMQALLRESEAPLAAPSANASGGVSPTRAEHVAASLGGRVPLILDGGACAAGLESTIVASDGALLRVLRDGPITREQLSAVASVDVAGADEGRGVVAPGMLARHYAPGKPIRLYAERPDADEFWISFARSEGDFRLSESGDPTEAAARLYDALHAAAASGRPRIAVSPIPQQGLGAAINDRLKRAAAD